MQIRLPLVLTFLAVAEMRSFRRAAEILNTTQPNVSGRISELETVIGQPLFHRSGNSVALTPRGQALLPFAERLRAAHLDFETEAGAGGEEAGILRVSVSESLVSPFLIRFLESCAMRFPRASFDIQIESTLNQRDDLIERRSDLAFLMGPVSHHTITNAALMSLPVIWVAARNHPAASFSDLTVREIAAKWPIISFSKQSRPYSQLMKHLRAQGIHEAQVFSSNSLNASLEMARALLGICTVPQSYVADQLERGELVLLKTDLPLEPLDFTASYHPDGGTSLASRAAQLALEVAETLRHQKS